MPARAVKPSTPTAAEVPVTSAMLAGVRNEVVHRIDQARDEARADTKKLDAKIDDTRADTKRLDAKIDDTRADMKKLDAKIDDTRAHLERLDAKIDEVKAEVHEVKASVARIEVLVEEQNARNKIVLDGITALLSRQNQVEQRVTDVEDNFRKLATARPAG